MASLVSRYLGHMLPGPVRSNHHRRQIPDPPHDRPRRLANRGVLGKASGPAGRYRGETAPPTRTATPHDAHPDGRWLPSCRAGVRLPGACLKPRQPPPSPTRAGIDTIDLIDPAAQAEADRLLTTTDIYRLAEGVRRREPPAPGANRTVLCLSGGGSYGAYSAGVARRLVRDLHSAAVRRGHGDQHRRPSSPRSPSSGRGTTR